MVKWLSFFQALTEAGAHVPESFDTLGLVIRSVCTVRVHCHSMHVHLYMYIVILWMYIDLLVLYIHGVCGV